MKIEKLNEHTQRTNDQISPKDGEEFTPEVLDKMSIEELEEIKKEMELRCKQRGSSRPVTHAKNHLDNKKNETDYLCMVKDVISSKLEESSDTNVKTFDQFDPVNETYKDYNPEHTWEYNLSQSVRWESEDAKDDVIYFIKNNMKEILKEDEDTILEIVKSVIESFSNYRDDMSYQSAKRWIDENL